MLEMRVDRVLSAIVEHELIKKGGRTNEALHFHLDVRLHQDNDSRSCGLHLLYHVRDGGSYVDVFSGETESPFDKIDKVKNWKHEVSHDSCWRDLNLFSDIYFRMAREINEARKRRKRRGQTKVAPKDMLQLNSFAMFGSLYEFVSIRITRADPSDFYCKTVEVLSR